MSEQPEAPPQAYYPLSFVDVTLDLPSNYPVVQLQEFESPFRTLEIPVGMTEGVAIAYAARRIATPRPLTHQLMIDVFAAFDLQVVTLRIVGVTNDSFSGELVVAGQRGQHSLPCRVSDGIALCLRQRPPAPITALPSVLDQAGTSN